MELLWAESSEKVYLQLHSNIHRSLQSKNVGNSRNRTTCEHISIYESVAPVELIDNNIVTI